MTGATLECPGTSCTEVTEEESIGPASKTDDTDTDENGSTSSEDYWLWIVIGLAVLVLIFFLVCCYYRRKAKKNVEFNAMLYATPATHDGDMI